MTHATLTDITPEQQQAEKQAFATLCAFLAQYPENLSGKTNWQAASETFIAKYYKKFLAERHSYLAPKRPETVPDPAVSLILKTCYAYTDEQAENTKSEHLDSMAAENVVGKLLERYIAQTLEPLGWVWCSGDFVRATDFIKQLKNGWLILQVKNRDNSENSSSSAIRDGTKIEKWHRTYSRTGKTNWENFPDEAARPLLSEAGFMQFIQTYFSK